MRRIVLFTTLLLSALLMWADDSYRFQTLTTADGLSSSTVKCMLIDNRGFLWIGTDEGLNLYDGYKVEAFGQQHDVPKLMEGIAELQEDAQGNVWIDCEDSYIIYDTNTRTLTNDVPTMLKGLGVDVGEQAYKVKVDDTGSLWILQPGRLFRYDWQSGRAESWKNANFDTGDVNFYACTATHETMLIAGKQGVWQFVRSTGRMEPLALPQEMQRKDNIYGTFIDTDRTLWVFSIIDECICRYSVGGKIIKEMLRLPSEGTDESKNNAIRDMMDDGQGNVWIATDHKGIFIYHKPTGEITHIEGARSKGQGASIPSQSLSSNNVISLAKDRQGTVWAGHFKTGISYWGASSRMFGNGGQTYGDISAMFRDSRGNLWIGTDGDGLYVEHPDGTSEKTALPNLTVSSFTEDMDDHTIWVGTYSDGLFQMSSPHQYKAYNIGNGLSPTNNAWRVIADNSQHIWCASPIHPLVRLNTQTGQWEGMKDEQGDHIYGMDFRLDRRGNLLIASTYGLVIHDNKTGKTRRYTTNLSGTQEMKVKTAVALCYDAKRDLLLMGHKQGLTLFDLQHDHLYYIENTPNRVDISVKSIEQDRQGIFWLSTANGISRLNVEQKKDGTLQWSIKNYAPREGQITPFFNGNSSVLTADGNVLFGGIDGYTLINPNNISTLPTTPLTPAIVSVTVAGRRIDTTDGHITLDPDDNPITIRYFTGQLNHTSTIRYAYKIEGMMSDWAYTKENNITLVGLSPGEYRLLLRTDDDEQTTDQQPCALSIHVRPPFYQTPWAWAIYTLIICTIGYLLWRHTRRQQQQKWQQQKEDLERQKLVQMTEMKLQFFTNISHDLRTPLTLIITPIDALVKKLENGQQPTTLLPQLKNIRKNAQLLLSQVSSLLDFRRLDVGAETLQASPSDIVTQLGTICLSFDDYSHERDITLQYTPSEPSFVMTYDKEKLNKMVYNLLSNAFKFTPQGGHISVQFSHDDHEATITVADTGRGIPDKDKHSIFHRFYRAETDDQSQTGSGIGLHIVKEYVTMHGGTVSVSDNTPQGSVFKIKLPLKTTSMEGSSQAEISMANTQSGDLPFTEGMEKGNESSILIVDDNPDILAFISNSLADDYDVRTATDGQSALDIVADQNISLIISDVMMPGIDGFELCRRLKSDIHTSHIPIILLTARTTDQSKIEGLQLGADDYITKPFNMDVLQLRVQKFMEWANKSHQEFKQKLDVNPSEITITPLDEQFLQKAIQLVEKQMTDTDFSVEKLGQQLGMSRSFLYKKLMAVTGLGPAEFIRTIRIKRGMALLERSQMQITEIAYAVGFNSLKSFTMNFKAEYGMTPSEYLKRKDEKV